jgi:PKD repeat protein
MSRISRVLQMAMTVLLVASSLPAESSADCRTWRWVNPRPAAHTLTDVAVGPERVVAVGEQGTIQVSPTGVSWTQVESGVSSDLAAVVWAGEQFLAFGESGTVLSSDDGLDWSAVNAGITNDLTIAAHGNGVTVAGGTGITVYSSTDGGSWTAVELDVERLDPWETTRLDSLIWAGDRFVGMGKWFAAVSQNGSSWTINQSRAAWGEGIVLVWDGSAILRISHYGVSQSFDGLSWTRVGDGVGLYDVGPDIYDIVWTGKELISVGKFWRLGLGLSSTEWIRTAYPDDDPYRYALAVAWTGERAIVVGTAGKIDISPNGIDWSEAQVADRSDVDLVAVAEGDDRLVAVSYYGDIAISHDGFDWELHSGFGHLGADIAYGNGRFVAQGDAFGSIVVSTDGLSWTTYDLEPDRITRINEVDWADNRFWALVAHRVYSSLDGETWTEEARHDTGYGTLNGIASANGITVIVGREKSTSSVCHRGCPIIASNRDGQWTWEVLDSEWDPFFDITWGADRWVVVTYSGKVLVSSDLEEWEIVWDEWDDYMNPVKLTRVAWNGSELLAAGAAGVISSPDGLTWQQESLPTSSYFYIYDLIWHDDYWITVGPSGMVLHGICDPELDTPQAGFTYETADLVAGAPVRFVDTSHCQMCTWSWSFGDGGTASAVNPMHVFATTGTYDVALSVCNEAGCDTMTRQVEISGNAPVADFLTEKTKVNAGEPIRLRDMSVGSPTDWEWHFGDGSLSREQHPTHTFARPGIYEVSLLASNAYGTGQVSKLVRAGNVMAVVDDLPEDARLTDLQQGNRRWVVVGFDGFVASSLDGARWTVHESGTTRNLRSVTWTGEAFVAVGDGIIVVSDNGTTWQVAVDRHSSDILRAVAGRPDAVVAVGVGGLLLRSEDLESWQDIDCGTTDDLTDVAANSELFVVAANGPMIESLTGLQWAPVEGNLNYTRAVAATAQGFVMANSDRAYRRDESGSWVPCTRFPQHVAAKDLAVLEDGSILIASSNEPYLNVMGSDDVVVPVPMEVPAWLYDIEMSGNSLYLLSSQGISTFPIHKRFTPRRGVRVDR